MAEQTSSKPDTNEKSFEEITEYATPKLFFHILYKGFQAGSLLGCAFTLPLALRHYAVRRSAQGLLPKALTLIEGSATMGTLLSGGMGAYKVWGTPLDEDAIKDRVYRLHYNEGQQRTDRFADAGMLAGGATFGMLFSARAVVGGACAGAAAGVLAHVATSKGTKKPNQMLEELKS